MEIIQNIKRIMVLYQILTLRNKTHINSELRFDLFITINLIG